MILRFSGLTVRDHVEILSTHLAMQSEAWNCEKCLAKKTPDARAAQGCEKPANQAIPLGENYRTTLCPGNYNTENAATLFEAYRLFKMGFLPCPGTVMEQPADIMEAFAVISHIEQEDERRKRIAAQRSKRGK